MLIVITVQIDSHECVPLSLSYTALEKSLLMEGMSGPMTIHPDIQFNRLMQWDSQQVMVDPT